MTDQPPEEPAAGPTRRLLLTGGVAAAAGAGAGALVAKLLDDPAPTPLGPGTIPGGEEGPWHYVAPAGPGEQTDTRGAAIQDAIDAGAKAILLGEGTYGVLDTLRLTPGCTLRGIGERTIIQANAELAALVEVGGGGPVGGVTIADLVLDAARQADLGLDVNIVGTKGNLREEPDAVCRFDNLWVLDPQSDGVVYRGTDTQACVTTRVRVRRATRYGFRVEAPDNVWLACEATTSGAGGAGFSIAVALEGSNGIGAANNHFHACKAWYCHEVGWAVGTGRNTFVGCEAQDTRSHGWHITAPRNTFTGCSADTAGMADVGGTPDTADGFFVEPGDELSLVGCMAFDRRPGKGAAQQRYGFNVPRSLVDDGLLVAPIGWGNTGGLINAR